MALKLPSCGRNVPVGYFGSLATLFGPGQALIVYLAFDERCNGLLIGPRAMGISIQAAYDTSKVAGSAEGNSVMKFIGPAFLVARQSVPDDVSEIRAR